MPPSTVNPMSTNASRKKASLAGYRMSQQQATENWTIEVNGLGSLGRKVIVTDVINRPFSVGLDRFNENPISCGSNVQYHISFSFCVLH